VLPGATCGACGWPVAGTFGAGGARLAGPGACTAGGAKVAEAIAAILGVEAAAQAARVATIHCGAKASQRLRKGHYTGIDTCLAISLVDGGGLACAYGCLGSGDCRSACPFGAIRMEEGLPVVDADLCTGCGQCVTLCPRRSFPASRRLSAGSSAAPPGPGPWSGRFARWGASAARCASVRCGNSSPSPSTSPRSTETEVRYRCQAAVEKCPTHCIVSPDRSAQTLPGRPFPRMKWRDRHRGAGQQRLPGAGRCLPRGPSSCLPDSCTMAPRAGEAGRGRRVSANPRKGERHDRQRGPRKIGRTGGRGAGLAAGQGV
jgi:Na+-translocating ferredoxin:NAD+ oxidoreductase RNF subunit RnfB